MHSNCRQKSPNCFSVCKSPGPFLMLMAPSLTVNSDFLPGKIFQPSRSWPLKSDCDDCGRNLTLRMAILVLAATTKAKGTRFFSGTPTKTFRLAAAEAHRQER